MKEVFPMIPASGGSLWILVLCMVIPAGLLVLFGWFGYASRHAQAVVSSEGLCIPGAIYGRTIPTSHLDLAAARALALTSEQDSDYRPRWRTNGLGLPGLQVGWFRLRNHEKALAYLTDRRHVAYIPTQDGYAVLLSVKDPEQLLNALREAAKT
jgi:hypothetical protein